MSEDGAALDARKPFRAQAAVTFDGFSGREQHGDVLVYPKGLLLRTRYLKPVGTGVEFDVEVEVEGNRSELLRGRGLVVFSRWQDQGQRRPAGLGVRIEQLDEASRLVLQRLFPPAPQGELLGRISVEAEAPEPPSPPGPPASPEPPFSAAPESPEPPSTGPAVSPARSTPAWLSPSIVEPEVAVERRADDADADAGVPASRPITATAGGWRDAASPPPSADGVYATTSRRWLEATAGEPMAPHDEASAGPAAPWPEAAAEPPRLEFAAHAESRSERPRLLPWILVGALLLALAAAGYWAYTKYFAAPEGAPAAVSTEPPAAAPAPQRMPTAAPGSTLVDDVLATTGKAQPPAVPPAGAERADEPAAPASPAPVSPLAAAPAFTRLIDIRWEAVGPGGLRVTLLADGPIPPSRVSNARLSAPARQVIRLRAPVQAFAKNQLNVGDALLARIRLGAQANGDLQIVLDLAADAVRAAEPRFEGERVEILLSR